jgi:phage tail protein X
MWLKMFYGSVVSYTETVVSARHGLAESSEARLTIAVLRTQRAQKNKKAPLCRSTVIT